MDWPSIASVGLMTAGVAVVVCCVFDVTPFTGAMADAAADAVTDGRLIAAVFAAASSVVIVVLRRRRRAGSRP